MSRIYSRMLPRSSTRSYTAEAAAQQQEATLKNGVRFLKWKRRETNMDQTARIKFGPYDATVQDQDGDRAVWQIYSADSPHNLAIAAGQRCHDGNDYDNAISDAATYLASFMDGRTSAKDCWRYVIEPFKRELHIHLERDAHYAGCRVCDVYSVMFVEYDAQTEAWAAMQTQYFPDFKSAEMCFAHRKYSDKPHEAHIKEHDPHYGTLIFCEHSPR